MGPFIEKIKPAFWMGLWIYNITTIAVLLILWRFFSPLWHQHGFGAAFIPGEIIWFLIMGINAICGLIALEGDFGARLGMPREEIKEA